MVLNTKLVQEMLWLFSELEALTAKPNNRLLIRRLFLRSYQIISPKHLWIGRGLRILQPGNIVLGERCALGDFVRIGNHALIAIGDDFIGATGLHMNSGTHDPASLQPYALPIRIGDRVWCGINVTILAGVTIGNDVVLGAGSVVCNDIPSNSVAVGVPAKVVKPLKRESLSQLWSWVRDI